MPIISLTWTVLLRYIYGCVALLHFLKRDILEKREQKQRKQSEKTSILFLSHFHINQKRKN